MDFSILHKNNLYDKSFECNENCIIKIKVDHKKETYIYYIFKNNNKYKIKRSITPNAYIWKLIPDISKREKIERETSIREIVDKLYTYNSYYDLYKEKYVENMKFNEDIISNYVRRIKDSGMEFTTEEEIGLNGFSTEAIIFDKPFKSWCITTDERKNHALELINYLLRESGLSGNDLFKY